MIHPLLRRVTLPIGCAIFAIVGGVAGGAATTSGLRLNSYGPEGTTIPRAEMTAIGGAPDCGDCSERALGYQWATTKAISAAVDCPQDSWNFQRGCVDYVKDPTDS